MSALLRITVITLALLACSQGHTLPGVPGVGSHNYGNYGRCPPCPGETRVPGFILIENYINHGNYGNRGDLGNYGRCPPCPGSGNNRNYGNHGNYGGRINPLIKD